MIIPPLVQAGLDKLTDKIQRFDHKQVSSAVQLSCAVTWSSADLYSGHY